MNKIIFPRPFAIAIDDLGWMKGHDDGQEGYGPYRTGLSRNMTLDDYKAVVDLAKRAGVRLQGLFILGEMDRENFLGDFPTTTFMRENWDNTENISDLQVEMMEYVKGVSSHLEFGLHGVGHEFWPEEGKRRRAEWYNTVDDHPWPEEEIRNHVKCFIRIMNQYGITMENGHSFPESFVPCAYSYYWNPDGTYSLGSVLGEFGVRFANTDFTKIPECNPPQEENGGGFDHSVHVMNRYNYGNLWSAPGKLPDTPLEEQPTDYIETHWPNLLFNAEESQEEITSKWTQYYQDVQSSEDRYCAKNTAQMHSQWLYNKYTKVTQTDEGLELDNTAMPDKVYNGHFPSNLVLKIKINVNQHVTSASLNNKPIAAYYEDQGYGFLYLPPLLQKKYFLKYELGSDMISDTVWHDTTSNILEISHKEEETKIDLCWYGDQKLTVLTKSEPSELESNNPGITIKGWSQEGDRIIIRLIAHDMQGEIGSIKIKY
ncbi:MAG: hypothetical protein CMP48_06720 [Rickettsiales bacterium]|nr:hypothetical protein [Rickettsiales bacterium]